METVTHGCVAPALLKVAMVHIMCQLDRARFAQAFTKLYPVCLVGGAEGD